MNGDRPIFGLILMVGFCALAPYHDALAKILGQTVPLGFIVFMRFAVQVAILVPVVLILRVDLRMPRRVVQLSVLRSVLQVSGLALIYLSLRYLPLADAIAIAYVMPFILLLLGWWWLGEVVGTRRLIACGVGFIGTLLVVQPSFAAVGAPALLPLGVAVVFALFMLVTRSVAKYADPIALQLLGGVISIVLLLPWAFLSGPEVLATATAKTWGTLFLMGAFGTVAHLMITWSLRLVPASTAAPMQYLEIAFATLIGWLLFRDFPNTLSLIGILITVGAGLYVIWRERKVSQAAP